jgi:hypothetical protein
LFRTLGIRRCLRRDGSRYGISLIGIFSTKGKYRGGTKQLYGVRPLSVPRQRRHCFPISPSEGDFGNRCAPETSPCHVQAKQNGELDPRKVTRLLPGAFAAESRPRRIRDRQSATHRLSSKPARHVGSLGWLRAFENPRSPARRPIQSDEVEPVAPVSRGGIVSQIETHSMCSLHCASVRRPARRAGPRLVQLLSMIGISRRIG